MSQQYSDIECQVIKAQIERRAKYREEFLKLRTDPCKHSQEAGYVFDEALQRFLSMKVTQFDHFTANPRTIKFGIVHLLPFFIFGAAVWKTRNEKERDIRCGRIKYRDRAFKLQ